MMWMHMLIIDGVLCIWKTFYVRHNDVESMEKTFNVPQNWRNRKRWWNLFITEGVLECAGNKVN
jgi:7-keto-8-aminopelargonate synthetase-like enzyme